MYDAKFHFIYEYQLGYVFLDWDEGDMFGVASLA